MPCAVKTEHRNLGQTDAKPGGRETRETQASMKRAKELAQRYDCEFVDLRQVALSPEHIRFERTDGFFIILLPLGPTPDGRIAIAVGDPSQLMLIDEISSQLGKSVIIKVASIAQIKQLLNNIDKP